jgi:hypothetical protein
MTGLGRLLGPAFRCWSAVVHVARAFDDRRVGGGATR